MKRFATVVVLTCALCVSAYAGDIPMTGPTPAVPGETQTPPGITQTPPEGGITQGPGIAAVILTLLSLVR